MRLITLALAVLALAIPAASSAGNPSGATPHQYRVYCASIDGVWVAKLQTCNGVPLSVWSGVVKP